MRIAFVILCMAVIGVYLVEFRQEEMKANYQARRLQTERLAQRRVLWDQDVRMGELKALERVQARAEDMNVSMLAPGQRKPLVSAGALADSQSKAPSKTR